MSDDFQHRAKRYNARQQIQALLKTLRSAVAKDPEQEVQGIALPVFLAVIEQVNAVLGDAPVVDAAAGIISLKNIESGEPIRAVDALLVAEQLEAAIASPAASVLPSRRVPTS